MRSPIELLKTAWTTYKQKFWIFIGYTGWLLVPIAAFLLLINLDNKYSAIGYVILTIAYIVISTIIVTILFRLSNASLLNTPVDDKALQDNLVQTAKNMLLTSLLVALAVFGGLLLLIIPGLVFIVWFGFAQIISVLEDKKPLAALTRSKELVTNRFWPIAWRLISGPVVIGVIYGIIFSIIVALIAIGTGMDLEILLEAEQPPAWVILIDTLGDVLMIPLLVLYLTALYHDLVAKKDKVLDKAAEIA